MSKFSIQMTVSVEVSRVVSAESMEEALETARALERDDPVRAGFIKIAPRTEYMWNNESKLTGVSAA